MYSLPKLQASTFCLRQLAPTKTSCRQVQTVARRAFLPRRWLTSESPEKNRTAILFPGQGSQYVGMGKDFYDQSQSAREVFEEVDEALGFKLSNLMFEGRQEELTQTYNAQPAILTTSIAAFRSLKKDFGFDITKEAHFALGHSLGEYSALVAADSLSLSDAVKIVRKRGIGMQECVKSLTQKTVMSALVLRRDSLRSFHDAMSLIQARLPAGQVVELANVNSSFQVVLSGTTEGVDYASRYLKDQKIAIRAVNLPVSGPFHCSLMAPARVPLADALAEVQINDPKLPVIFNATSKPLSPQAGGTAEIIKTHLIQQIDHTVPWYYSIQYCKRAGVNRFITLGPNKVLGNLVRKDHPSDWIRFVTTPEECQAEFGAQPISDSVPVTDFRPAPSASILPSLTSTPLSVLAA